MSVRELICDLSEVLVCLPFTEGAESSRCSMALGGSESQSREMVHRSTYNETQGESKQKSCIGGCLMNWDSIT